METKEAYLDMKDIKPEFVDDQIKIRQELIGQMIGSLYPDILNGEIEQLKLMKKNKDDFLKENEMEI